VERIQGGEAVRVTGSHGQGREPVRQRPQRLVALVEVQEHRGAAGAGQAGRAWNERQLGDELPKQILATAGPGGSVDGPGASGFPWLQGHPEGPAPRIAQILKQRGPSKPP
jgi:hypothetical protein